MPARGTAQLRIAGQVGIVPGEAGVQAEADFAVPWARALAHIATVLLAAGATPAHLVMLRVHVTDIGEFTQNGPAVGEAALRSVPLRPRREC